jgi:flagellar hook assembly protein FlgD
MVIETLEKKMVAGQIFGNIPQAFKFDQNFPNPFRQITNIHFEIPGAENVLVRMDIFSLQGKLMRTLVNGSRSPGYYTIFWDGRGNNNQAVPCGTYLCRFSAGNFIDNKRIALIK